MIKTDPELILLGLFLIGWLLFYLVKIKPFFLKHFDRLSKLVVTDGIVKYVNVTPITEKRWYHTWRSFRDEKRKWRWFDVVYQFDVGGKTYVSNHYYPSLRDMFGVSLYRHSRRKILAYLVPTLEEAYPTGNKVDVYYDPDNPSYCYLNPMNHKLYKYALLSSYWGVFTVALIQLLHESNILRFAFQFLGINYPF